MARKSLYIAALLMLSLVACTSTIEGGDIEEQVAEDIQDEQGVAVEVVCPDDIEAKDGGEFTCTATDPDGNEIPIEVVQQDDEGNVNWTMNVLNLPVIEESLAPDVTAQVNAEITIDCPDQLVVAEAGNSIDCEATDDLGGEGIIRITATDSEGNVEWELNP